jgi:hypothetical protein
LTCLGSHHLSDEEAPPSDFLHSGDFVLEELTLTNERVGAQSPSADHTLRNQGQSGLVMGQAVFWEIYDQESGERTTELLQRTVLAEHCTGQPLVLHSDNGALMKSVTLLGKLYDPGITPSRGRPRVSNDNPYSESLFRTLKYCPQWPQEGFADLYVARSWVRDFIHWYNHEHRHSRIRFVPPEQRYRGEDQEVPAKRDALYLHPHCRAGATRNWQPICAVTLKYRAGATGTENSSVKTRLARQQPCKTPSPAECVQPNQKSCPMGQPT